MGQFTAQEIIDQVNEYREKQGLVPLKINPVLMKAAQERANNMGSTGEFSHSIATTTDMTTPWAFMKKSGYKYDYAGENLAEGFDNATDTLQGWQKSKEHNNNLISPNFSETGVALAPGMYQGKPTTFVIQFLGKSSPATSSVPIAPTTTPTSSASEARNLPIESMKVPKAASVPKTSKPPATVLPLRAEPPKVPAFFLPNNLQSFANSQSTIPRVDKLTVPKFK